MQFTHGTTGRTSGVGRDSRDRSRWHRGDRRRHPDGASRPAALETCAVLNTDLAGHWRELAAGSLDVLDARIQGHIDELVDLEAGFGAAVAGTSLLHGNLRTDNMVFSTTSLGRQADTDAVDVVLAAITGYFIGRSLQPPPPGLPTVRNFQAVQGAVALDWPTKRLPYLG